MTTSLIHSFQSEWLKTRRSLASWLVLFGGFFIPLLSTISGILRTGHTQSLLKSPDYWTAIIHHNWQFMAFLLLPMGLVLATSLISQLEFRNNSWKQTHTTPQYFATIFAAKLAVILAMLLQFFVLFNIGIVLSGIIPALYHGNFSLPTAVFPYYQLLQLSFFFFINSLPIIALQYLLSLQFKNFLVPLSIGIGLTIGAIIALPWQHSVWIPYGYCAIYFNQIRGFGAANQPIHYYALGFALLFTLISYILYITKNEKG